MRLKWFKQAKPKDVPERPGLRLKERGPEPPSTNPIVEHWPEPAKHRPRKRLPWGKLLVVALILAAGAVGVRYLLGFAARNDADVWGAALRLMKVYKSTPPDTETLRYLNGIVRKMTPEMRRNEACAGLMAVYALGSLKLGNHRAWSSVTQTLKRDHPDSEFQELAGGVKFSSSGREECRECTSSGTCRSCGGTGRRTSAMTNTDKGRHRVIGSSLGKPDVPDSCLACRGKGKCRRCGGAASVVWTDRQPLPNEADIQTCWASAVKKATRRVQFQYWQARGGQELTKIRSWLWDSDVADSLPEVEADEEEADLPAPTGNRESSVTWETPRPAVPARDSTALVSPDAFPRGEPPAKVAGRSAAYKNKIHMIEELYAGRVGKWEEGYVAELRQLLANVQEEGNLEAYEKIEAEIDRFEGSRDIAPALAPSALAQVNDLRANYSTALLKFKLDRSRLIISAAEDHAGHLNLLVRELTRDGKIEEARDARAFGRSIDSDLNDLKFRQAELEADLRSLAAEAETSPEADEKRGPEVVRLVSLRAIFDEQAAAIEEDYKKNLLSWGDEYAAALKRLKAEMQKGGDLEAWEAVEDEMKRFLVEENVERDLPGGLPAGLRNARDRYRKLWDSYPEERRQRLTALTGKYVRHLTALKQTLVREGRVVQAREVRAEMARAKASCP